MRRTCRQIPLCQKCRRHRRGLNKFKLCRYCLEQRRCQRCGDVNPAWKKGVWCAPCKASWALVTLLHSNEPGRRRELEDLEFWLCVYQHRAAVRLPLFGD